MAHNDDTPVSRSMSLSRTEQLRTQLENLQLEHGHSQIPAQNGPSQEDSVFLTPPDDTPSMRRLSGSAHHHERARSSSTRRRNGSRSQSRRDGSNPPHHILHSEANQMARRPPLRGKTLYTIESRMDDTEAARKFRQENDTTTPKTLNRALSDGDETIASTSTSAATSSTVKTSGRSRYRNLGSELRRLKGNARDMASAAETSATVARYRDWAAKQRELQRYWTTLPASRLRARLACLYDEWISKRLLRQFTMPPSPDGRHVPVSADCLAMQALTDSRTGQSYVSNFIRSSRYTVWTFFPKQFFFQFSKLANFYFLVIGILQMIPGLSTTGTYTTIGPLFAFVMVSMAKEGYDDYRRYKMDKVENRAAACVLQPRQAPHASTRRRSRGTRQVSTPGGVDDGWTGGNDDECWSTIKWQELQVGNIIKLKRDDNVPADIVLLHATGPNGVAYIETMALDGETNLKSKEACPLFAEHCGSLAALRRCQATVISEDPNLDLYNYEGKAVVDEKVMPLTLNQVVYRGSTLRNTAAAIGVVINTGEECKIRMNASKDVHAKSPAMQAIVNRIIILLVCFVLLLTVGCSMGYLVWQHKNGQDAWYLLRAGVPFQHIFIGFLIEFNTLIPLSLYVSLELIKLGQFLLMKDVDMYDPVTDTPMVANTTTILENLGQVSYVFSDKTGTLTQNMMKFRKLSVGGAAWLHDLDMVTPEERAARRQSNRASRYAIPRRRSSVWKATARPTAAQPELTTEDMLEYICRRPSTSFARTARQMLLCIALCHTCLPERNASGKIEYQAASPDELALVEAARDLDYLVIDRTTQSVTLQLDDEDGKPVSQTYQVLDVIEFTSKRKCMSIIVRMPDGQICVMSKGADSSILPRLRRSGLALQTAATVERRASVRKSVEQEHALRRRASTQGASVVGPAVASAANALSQGGTMLGLGHKNNAETVRRASVAVDDWLTSREAAVLDVPDDELTTHLPGRSQSRLGMKDAHAIPYDVGDEAFDDTLALDDQVIFERCFQHIDDFATEGLRTLLYAYSYIDEATYKTWKVIYHAASTSLVDRQARIDAAAEQIEQNLLLAGATAIEDKLQDGVPETIDKLRRARIKVWMLTGDKRETAINIAHSARICKPFSEVYILDVAEGALQEQIASLLVDVGRGLTPHSVVVIDGHTLSIVEEDENLKDFFFDLVARVDSVICCRASPSQKATLVKCIRDRVPDALTLAIGDGANDIAMIQASHVGIGISGREGLQAARISDYSIAQFRFLQKLLFVHGRWNYIRTGKYILGTFWKEIVFYLVQAQYQRANGYTGTSLYESASLAVFNTLFTSLAVILIGIFEQDLSAETLLAIPELYTYGQRNRGFSFHKYIGWMFMAVVEALIIWWGLYYVFVASAFTSDNSLNAIGTMAFSICIIFINTKMLILELHHKTFIPLIGFVVTVAGWFLWNIFLASVYKRSPGPYEVRDGFTHNFGRQPRWWATLAMVWATAVVWELVVAALRRVYFPRDEDLMQEVERYDGVKDVLREHAVETGASVAVAAGAAGDVVAASVAANGPGGDAERGEGSSKNKRPSTKGKGKAGADSHADMAEGGSIPLAEMRSPRFSDPFVGFTAPSTSTNTTGKQDGEKNRGRQSVSITITNVDGPDDADALPSSVMPRANSSRRSPRAMSGDSRFKDEGIELVEQQRGRTMR